MIEDVIYNQWSIILGLLYTGWLTSRIVKRTTKGRKEKAGCVDVIRVFLIIGGLFGLTVFGSVAFGSMFIRTLFSLINGTVVFSIELFAELICYGTMVAVLVFAFIGVMLYGMGRDMRRYNRLARLLGLGVLVPLVMLVFEGALVYALVRNIHNIPLSVLLTVFILILLIGFILYVKIIREEITGLIEKEKNASRSKENKTKGITQDKSVTRSQTANHSRQESNRSTQRTNKPNPHNDEWKRRSNRRKKR
ncbi:hypothetical protein [Myroides odoratimimus]|uniref:DUF2304 domain-containing protein n=1 Tax=Myroides odoratimimus CIP 101113 TaxID=883154 RepID=A0AAV3F7W7_9FLAO|nr:hypothetical protein [Myroides odoratimimus]EHO15116.1 hypothetical protein HMPREF9715_00304 [Myroides odoratimimus CIP 101113]